ncbi:unnamed protein product [Cercopithifilaria johnstoni]|uniref:Uncharacterized protein n=1 Tax=Cercopithifilaria johnstoni TaxID=2874296 RepID=A0A8J2MQ11_9BILA|nr:unnamed protein product [Cercopithifilaria johnstoni]
MQSPLSANDNSQECANNNSDGRGVHLIYSEYDCAPSEIDVEVIEGAKHYWWQSSKSSGREVCLVYSDYDEPSSETSVEMNQLFHNNKINGREVRLIYSEYDEPPSETDVEYDGRPWCSIFGNPALWKIRDEGRETHLIYSDYTEPKSEAAVEIEYDSDLETSDEELNTGRPPKFRSIYVRDSIELIEQSSILVEKSVMPVQHLSNMEQLLAFADNTKSDSSMLSAISNDCDTALGNSFSMDQNASSNSG